MIVGQGKALREKRGGADLNAGLAKVIARLDFETSDRWGDVAEGALGGESDDWSLCANEGETLTP